MIKLVIWDLDDTLWRGTLADGDEVTLVQRRADLVKALNRHGVVSSIASKNDPDAARAKLIQFGLWDEFVFPHVAFEPKQQAVAAIIAAMQLRSADVLFVDDNPINLHEARHAMPDLNILDITQPGSDALIEAILSEQPASRNRIAEYRSLERRNGDKGAIGMADADFLRTCAIRACTVAMMANLDFVDRIVELVNRSNQLNYTGSRVGRDELHRDMIDGYLEYYCWSIFASDKYGDHGLIGFAMIHRRTKHLKHFVFSCRIMHVGFEAHMLRTIAKQFPQVHVPSVWQQRLGLVDPDWIEDMPYDDPVTRQALFDSHGPTVHVQPDIRIMCACQSGGLAHFSRTRDTIDFDIWPRLFALRDFAQQDGSAQSYPPYLVYGAGTDYKNESWPGLSHLLDNGLYRSCVARLCELLMQREINALIILPPENLVEHQYGPEGLSRSRTMRYNALWREMMMQYPCLTVLEVEHVCAPEDMIDVNHHRPAGLNEVARWIDIWYDQERAARGGDLATAA